MANLHVLSDLHMEFSMIKGHRAPTGTDVVILAGDTHPGVLGILWAQETFGDLPVLYLPGNHEYYGRRALDRHERAMREKADGTAVRLMNRDTAVLAGTRFICATLWTDYALHGDRDLAMLRAKQQMNDYQRICSTMNRDLLPVHLLREHERALAFIAAELAVPFAGPTVVVTHHAPSERSLPEHRRTDGLGPCYASSLEDLILDHAPELWIHGHIHTSQDYEIGQTRILANPRGYLEHRRPPQNLDFDPVAGSRSRHARLLPCRYRRWHPKTIWSVQRRLERRGQAGCHDPRADIRSTTRY